MPDCVFCSIPEDRVIFETSLFFIIEDKFPVSNLHCLIIAKRHVSKYFNLTSDEKLELIEATELAKTYVDAKDPTIDGYNIGINVGE